MCPQCMDALMALQTNEWMDGQTNRGTNKQKKHHTNKKNIMPINGA